MENSPFQRGDNQSGNTGDGITIRRYGEYSGKKEGKKTEEKEETRKKKIKKWKWKIETEDKLMRKRRWQDIRQKDC